MQNRKVMLITEKKIKTGKERIELSLNCERLNFANLGICYVDKDFSRFYELIKIALKYAKTYHDKKEINRLTVILDSKPNCNV
ncbi:hypothetical protein EZS27_000345 [termite gut metagenome]|uniref:Uncharacterized protein n=1 Tax=termite gut metagenome TaxID=433724 RepID=A0A5J4T4U3_9ZZZZ